MADNLSPLLFIGHGSPMNALEDNEFSRTWESLGKRLPKPEAILCISAHWETHGTRVTAMERPRTIHDFGGFPRELFEIEYPADGSPDLADMIVKTVTGVDIRPDTTWGLDHGSWSVLRRMFPNADIPVLQLSLDFSLDGEYHYELGRKLLFLRRQGVMIMGSGNIVHDLGNIRWGGQPHDWAREFDLNVKQHIKKQNHAPLIHYREMGQPANLSINTGEHYLPLLYVLALQQKDEPVKFFNESIFAASVSMRGFTIGF